MVPKLLNDVSNTFDSFDFTLQDGAEGSNQGENGEFSTKTSGGMDLPVLDREEESGDEPGKSV